MLAAPQELRSNIVLKAVGNDLIISNPSLTGSESQLIQQSDGLYIDGLREIGGDSIIYRAQEVIIHNSTFTEDKLSIDHDTNAHVELTCEDGSSEIVLNEGTGDSATINLTDGVLTTTVGSFPVTQSTSALTVSDKLIITTAESRLLGPLNVNNQTLWNTPIIRSTASTTFNVGSNVVMSILPSIVNLSKDLDLGGNDIDSAHIIQADVVDITELNSPNTNIISNNPIKHHETIYGEGITYNSKEVITFEDNLAGMVINLSQAADAPIIKSGTNSLTVDLGTNIISMSYDGASVNGYFNMNYHELQGLSGINNYLNTPIPITVNDNEIIVINETDLTLHNDGPATININADTSNTNEFANPLIHLTQDGGVTHGYLGLSGSANTLPNGGTCYGATDNGLTIHANNSTTLASNVNITIAPNADTNDNKLTFYSNHATFTNGMPLIIDLGQTYWLSNLSTTLTAMRLLSDDPTNNNFQYDAVIRRCKVYGFKISTDGDTTGDITATVRLTKNDGTWVAASGTVSTANTSILIVSTTFYIESTEKYYLLCNSTTSNGREVRAIALLEPFWN